MSALQNKDNNKIKIYTAVIIVLVLALVIAANIFMSVLESTSDLRIDLSKQRIFSLSQETMNVLEDIGQDIEIYTLYTPRNEDKNILELIHKYEAFTPKVTAENVDVLKNPSFINDFDPENKGIDKDACIIVTDSKKEHYKILKESELYLVNPETGMVFATLAEQKITSAVNYVKTGVVNTIRIMTGHNETAASSYLTILNALNTRGYELASYNVLENKDELNAENDTLLIINPKSDLSDEEYEIITEFLDGGGSLFITMQNCITEQNTATMQLVINSFENFKSLLLLYDLEVKKDILIGQDSSHYYQQTTNLIPHMLENPVTAPIIKAGGNVVLYCNSSIEIKQLTNTKITPLLMTDESCFEKTVNEELNSLEKTDKDKEGNYIIGIIAEKNQSKIALFTSDSILSDSTSTSADNLDLAFNTLSYLSEQEDSIAIMPKLLVSETMEIESDLQKNILSIIVIYLLPAIVFIAGFIVWRKRKNL